MVAEFGAAAYSVTNVGVVQLPRAKPRSRTKTRSKVKRANPVREHNTRAKSKQAALHVVGDVAPRGEAIGLQIERSEQGPVDLGIRTEDLKYLAAQNARIARLMSSPCASSIWACRYSQNRTPDAVSAHR